MARIDFPDPLEHQGPRWLTDGEFYYPAKGIVHLGGELSIENLRNAYRKGIFPWYTPGLPLPWHSPDPRAILVFDEVKIPRSLAKLRRQGKFTFTIDHDFRSVIAACAASERPDQPGTWITDEFIEVYSELHKAGDAHSVEAWNKDGELVGGLYGVDAGGVFCGESMFYKEANASKLALLFLIDHLRLRGSTWLDVQVMTPHLETLGAREIARDVFLAKLRSAQQASNRLFSDVK